jgi:hypothetical protein|tara:strand:+ start:576 stop:773 length:198 start_codon:yes stop_codon:yes gene_type:complete
MTNRALARKFEMTRKLSAIEKTVASVVIERRRALSQLVKMKNYATMQECNFRDKQLKKLIGERNG